MDDLSLAAVAVFLSLFGLLSALIGDGVYDLLSWLSLGVPLGLVGVVWLRLHRR